MSGSTEQTYGNSVCNFFGELDEQLLNARTALEDEYSRKRTQHMLSLLGDGRAMEVDELAWCMGEGEYTSPSSLYCSYGYVYDYEENKDGKQFDDCDDHVSLVVKVTKFHLQTEEHGLRYCPSFDYTYTLYIRLDDNIYKIYKVPHLPHFEMKERSLSDLTGQVLYEGDDEERAIGIFLNYQNVFP